MPAASGKADAAKELFKEALEKKRGQQHKGAVGGHGDSKVHHEQASAGRKRTFRRKSGG